MSALDELRSQPRKGVPKDTCKCGGSTEAYLVLAIREKGQGSPQLASKTATVCGECAVRELGEFSERWS